MRYKFSIEYFYGLEKPFNQWFWAYFDIRLTVLEGFQILCEA